MSLRAQALLEFGLPAAPQRVDDLPSPALTAEACRVHAPAGRFFLLCSESALAVAFEATLFDLLVEARFPAPRPLRTGRGSMIARLTCPSGATAAAACYPWPPGEELSVPAATVPQLLEVGRLLARLHQLGETHPAAVADPCDPRALLARIPRSSPARAELAPVLEAGLTPLPSGAVHGGLQPSRAMFVGERSSAVLPSGIACFGPLVLDVAETALGWMTPAKWPMAALRAIISGYQALRRLLPEERASLFAALRFAAARTGGRMAVLRHENPLFALRLVDELGKDEVLSAAG